MSADRPTAPATTDRARARLRRAITLAAEHKFASARRAAAAALADAPRDAVVAIAAGLVLYVTRDHHVALEALGRAAQLGGGARTHWLRRERAAWLGWDLDAKAALLDGARAEPNEPRWPAALLALHAHRRSWDEALRSAEQLAQSAPDDAGTLMEIAGVHAALGDREALERCLARALANADIVPVRLEAARLLRVVGAFDAARAHGEAVLARSADDVHANVALAELALWTSDHPRAARFARAALASGPSAPAARVLGAIAWLDGQRDEAVTQLERAVRLDSTDADAHAWLAEIAIAEHRSDDAHAAISRAIAAGGGVVFAGQILRLRVKLEEPRAVEWLFAPHLIAHQRAPLRALVPELAAVLDGFDRDGWRALLDTALQRMHGNRSTVATYFYEGTLRLVPHIRDPRAESRRALERVRLEPAEKLLLELDEVRRSFPRSPLPLAHYGELLLWMGRLDEARTALDGALAIETGTRWAYIGLGAIDMLSGDPERALVTLEDGVRAMQNTTGPAVYVHRGEALRRLGRLAEAKVDLVRAVELNPARLSGWINLALLHVANGELEQARSLTAEVFARAPGLVSDAAREVSVELFGDGAPAELEPIGRVLDHALAMLRGNRSSSCITYFTSEGALRFARNTSRGAPPVHANDAEDLRLALSVLLRGPAALRRPGHRPPSSASAAPSSAARPGVAPSSTSLPSNPATKSAATPRAPTLSREEVAHFIEHGFVRLDGCVSRDVVDAWVARVRARAESDPRRWLQFDASRVPVPPERVDFDDPSSLPADTVIVLGAEATRVEQLSPRLWGAVCDLLGEDAVRTRELSDHVIVRVPWSGPTPPLEHRRRGWHIDDPSTATRLDGITNGLVGLLLLSDLEPDGGATWIAPESVGHVARLIASHPAGVDLVDASVGPGIVSRCTRLVECTGRAGDVYLVHPLMVHCGSMDLRKTLRWLSKPNFALRAPLDPLRRDAAQRSPVEEAIVRALPPNDAG